MRAWLLGAFLFVFPAVAVAQPARGGAAPAHPPSPDATALSQQLYFQQMLMFQTYYGLGVYQQALAQQQHQQQGGQPRPGELADAGAGAAAPDYTHFPAELNAGALGSDAAAPTDDTTQGATRTRVTATPIAVAPPANGATDQGAASGASEASSIAPVPAQPALPIGETESAPPAQTTVATGAPVPAVPPRPSPTLAPRAERTFAEPATPRDIVRAETPASSPFEHHRLLIVSAAILFSLGAIAIAYRRRLRA